MPDELPDDVNIPRIVPGSIADRRVKRIDRRVSNEDRRATRNLKHWLVKLVATTFMIVVVASIMSLIYSAIRQEKDLDTAFIGELFKNLISFITFLLT